MKMMPSDIMDSMCNTVTLSGTESDTITIPADTVSLDDIAMGFSDTTCDVNQGGHVPTGFYIVDANATQTFPKVWVEIDSSGVCVNKGIC